MAPAFVLNFDGIMLFGYSIGLLMKINTVMPVFGARSVRFGHCQSVLF
jgi:hypothetical protein